MLFFVLQKLKFKMHPSENLDLKQNSRNFNQNLYLISNPDPFAVIEISIKPQNKTAF